MTCVVRILPEAETELAEAAEWYESKRAGLGVQFMSVMDRVLDTIREAPDAWSIWKAGYPYRKHVVRRFPYVIFFDVTDDGIVVHAFAHARRRPGYWMDRAR